MSDDERKASPIEAHKEAAAIANHAVFAKYNTDKWSVGSEVHQFWLDIYDRTFAKLLMWERKDEQA